MSVTAIKFGQTILTGGVYFGEKCPVIGEFCGDYCIKRDAKGDVLHNYCAHLYARDKTIDNCRADNCFRLGFSKIVEG